MCVAWGVKLVKYVIIYLFILGAERKLHFRKVVTCCLRGLSAQKWFHSKNTITLKSVIYGLCKINSSLWCRNVDTTLFYFISPPRCSTWRCLSLAGIHSLKVACLISWEVVAEFSVFISTAFLPSAMLTGTVYRKCQFWGMTGTRWCASIKFSSPQTSVSQV